VQKNLKQRFEKITVLPEEPRLELRKSESLNPGKLQQRPASVHAREAATVIDERLKDLPHVHAPDMGCGAGRPGKFSSETQTRISRDR